MSPSLRKAVAAAIGGGAVAIASVLITGPSGDDGLEGVSYIPYKDIVGVWTVCYGHTGKDIMLGKRLRFNAVCPDMHKITAASGVDDGASPRLTDTAQRDYFTLRKRIETSDKMIRGLQQYIRTQCVR